MENVYSRAVLPPGTAAGVPGHRAGVHPIGTPKSSHHIDAAEYQWRNSRKKTRVKPYLFPVQPPVPQVERFPCSASSDRSEIGAPETDESSQTRAQCCVEMQAKRV